MSDRSLRGMRLGSQSMESETGVEPAARKIVEYKCPNGHEFKVPFSTEATIPTIWGCKCGIEASLLDGETPEEDPEKTVRNHWDMLLERRTKEELEQILADRLKVIRSRRKRVVTEKS